MVCGLITRVNLVPLANRSDFTPCRVVMQAFRSMGYNKLELNNAMMKKINVLSSLLLILLLIAPVIANAQAATQTLSFSPESSIRSEEHTSELQSRGHLVCRLLLEKKNLN